MPFQAWMPCRKNQTIAALDRSQATLEFTPQGRIITANANVLPIVGYNAEEIRGQHHSLLVNPVDTQSDVYLAFWASRAKGVYREGVFKRITKSGDEVWLQATTNPIIEPTGRTRKIIKFAYDVTKTQRNRYWIPLAINPVDARNGQLDRFISVQANVTATKLKAIGSSARIAAIYGYRTIVAGEDRLKLERGQSLTLNLNFRHSDNRDVALSSTLQPLRDVEGKLHRVVVYAVDMTERSNAVSKMTGSVLPQIDETAMHISQVSARTNRLALNTTIESARAGDAGRGFGVVTSEVTALAQRSTSLSTEIAGLVAKTQINIEELRRA